MPPVRNATNGITYFMYFEVRHNVPHLHVGYGGDLASIAINDGRVLSGGLRNKQLAESRKWIALHREEWLTMWSNRLAPGGVYTIKD